VLNGYPVAKSASRESASPAPRGPSKDLLGLEGLPRGEITAILDEAAGMRQVVRGGGRPDALAGRTVCLMFFEPSTRTSQSFARAARGVSADVVSFSAGAASSTSKGETPLDTARNLEAIASPDVFVVRHGRSGAPARLAALVRAGVVNAGDGWHEHPTQALGDMFTLRDRLGRIEGLHVSIVGDIRHSRVARSNLWGMTAMGARVTLVAPPAWMPEGVTSLAPDVEVSHDLDAVLPSLDAVMALRIQRERLGSDPGPAPGEYAAEYGLTRERMARAKPECLVLHPGPVNRGVEVTGEVADSPRSLILEQAANGVFVRMAVLARCVSGLEAGGGG
jgi:aspartate carbamoyltransferase catalytic subunit